MRVLRAWSSVTPFNSSPAALSSLLEQWTRRLWSAEAPPRLVPFFLLKPLFIMTRDGTSSDLEKKHLRNRDRERVRSASRLKKKQPKVRDGEPDLCLPTPRSQAGIRDSWVQSLLPDFTYAPVDMMLLADSRILMIIMTLMSIHLRHKMLEG